MVRLVVTSRPVYWVSGVARWSGSWVGCLSAGVRVGTGDRPKAPDGWCRSGSCCQPARPRPERARTRPTAQLSPATSMGPLLTIPVPRQHPRVQPELARQPRHRHRRSSSHVIRHEPQPRQRAQLHRHTQHRRRRPPQPNKRLLSRRQREKRLGTRSGALYLGLGQHVDLGRPGVR